MNYLYFKVETDILNYSGASIIINIKNVFLFYILN